MVLTQNPVLRQGAVAHCVESLVLPQMVHWNTEALINFLIVQDVVTVTAMIRPRTAQSTHQGKTCNKCIHQHFIQ